MLDAANLRPSRSESPPKPPSARQEDKEQLEGRAIASALAVVLLAALAGLGWQLSQTWLLYGSVMAAVLMASYLGDCRKRLKDIADRATTEAWLARRENGPQGAAERES